MEIALYIVDIREELPEEENIAQEIAPFYKEKYYSIKARQKARQELYTGYLLRKYLGVKEEGDLSFGEDGKPYLTNGSCFFNVSHCKDMVALAIADKEVGVDLERIRPYHRGTAQKVFLEEEVGYLESLEKGERDKEFIKLWTCCEAALKVGGTGFHNSWEEIRKIRSSVVTQTVSLEGSFVTIAANEEFILKICKNSSKELLLR